MSVEDDRRRIQRLEIQMKEFEEAMDRSSKVIKKIEKRLDTIDKELAKRWAKS